MTDDLPSPDERWLQKLLGVNVFVSGVLFGILQWCIFFLLQSYIASTAIVYLLGSSAWLLGSVVGLALSVDRSENAWLLAALGIYYVFSFAAVTFPYQLNLLPALLIGIAGVGCYAGRFFIYRAGTFRRTKWLFFIENCGFVAGMLLTIAGVCEFGATAHWAMPAIAGAVVLMTLWPLKPNVADVGATSGEST